MKKVELTLIQGGKSGSKEVARPREKTSRERMTRADRSLERFYIWVSSFDSLPFRAKYWAIQKLSALYGGYKNLDVGDRKAAVNE